MAGSSLSLSGLPNIVLDAKLDVEFSSCGTTHSYDFSSSAGPPVLVKETWSRKRRLGSGSYGTVWLESCTLGPKFGQSRALKVISIPRSETDKVDIARELQALVKFSHKRVCASFIENWVSAYKFPVSPPLC